MPYKRKLFIFFFRLIKLSQDKSTLQQTGQGIEKSLYLCYDLQKSHLDKISEFYHLSKSTL